MLIFQIIMTSLCFVLAFVMLWEIRLEHKESCFWGISEKVYNLRKDLVIGCLCMAIAWCVGAVCFEAKSTMFLACGILWTINGGIWGFLI